MTRPLKTAVALSVACILPLFTLRAQQPAPGGQPNQPTAKDVIKAVEKSEGASKTSSDPIARIQDEGLKRSQVMATLSYLTDVIGPRLTGSPGLKRANEWTRDKLASWGLENARLEPWGSFGRGWSLTRFSAQLVEPQCVPLIAYPKAWSPGLDGTLVAEVVHLDAKSESDLAKYKGKLKGAIVLTGPARDLSARFEPLARRLNETELLKLANAPEPTQRKLGRRPQGRGPQGQAFARKKFQFLVDEGAALLVDCSGSGDGGTLFVASASVPGGASSGPNSRTPSPWAKDAPGTVPQVVMAAEHYNRMVRMLAQGEKLRAAVELSVRFHDADPLAYNTVAEIPGTDLKHELVMLGGHMDSWHSGTGATDNAAGISVAMEAVRILKALGLKPRRTVRIALWTGEEQGLLGSRGYVAKHFGRPPSPRGGTSPGGGDSPTKAEHESFSAYFNLDNGTGKVRGVYLQGNEAVRPLFRQWLQPFREMGASTLSIANTGGTDHLSFDAVGLPGFQFIQDEVEYDTRTHHSNQDVYDRIQADDMKQAAVIMAAFVYNTAMRDEKLPRKPRPRPPVTATVQTTLGTASEQVRQYAFDGDRGTFFASDRDAKGDDHFTLVFDEPVAVKSIAVDTGKAAGGGDKLDAGTLQVSADGKSFEPLGKFADGSVRCELKDRPVLAIRIKPEGDLKHPLAIRELAVESDPPAATFAYPVEIAVDVSDAPEMKDWADKAARACERAYPQINEELRGEGFKPPARITMTLKKDYRGVASTRGDRITGSVSYFKAHPDDIGAMVHETTHVVQHYGGRGNNPSWLVEGVADYVRFFKYEPGKLGPIDPNRARYDRSYRVTAAFLAYLAETYDQDIASRLNTLMREGKYKEDAFRDLTGKSVRQLDEEWRASLQRKDAAAQ